MLVIPGGACREGGGAVPVTGEPKGDGVRPVHPLEVVRAGRWTRALFGTFALSLGFFEAAPLRALRRVGARDIRILSDVSGVAASLGEAGAREVGRTYAVDAIEVPAGCFHPKFILLDGEDGPRLVIGSGNLTFGGWGRNLELCEVLSPATSPASFGDMADFLESLATTPRVDPHRIGSTRCSSWRQTAAWSTARRTGIPAQTASRRCRERRHDRSAFPDQVREHDLDNFPVGELHAWPEPISAEHFASQASAEQRILERLMRSPARCISNSVAAMNN